MARSSEQPAEPAAATTATRADNDVPEKMNPNSKCSGVEGIRLKRFEEVVAKLLASVEPEYVRLPPPPRPVAGNETNGETSNDSNGDWLFSGLPSSARVVGNHPNPKRARNKEGQLRSMLRGVLHLIPPQQQNQNEKQNQNPNQKQNLNQNRPTTIVDFGGGSGHLGIPLALLLPHCRIIVVDFNERSIDLLHKKANAVIRQVETEMDPQRRKRYSGFASQIPKQSTSTSKSSALDLRCCGKKSHESNANATAATGGGILANLFTFCGPVEQFVGEAFHVATALHLCGEATDVCLRTAIQQKAAAIVVAPCCVGKLSGNAFNPDVYNATGQNEATVSYPQSAVFGKILSSCSGESSSSNSNNNNNNNTSLPGYKIQQDWNALAKAADYSNETEFRTSRNASRRTAKALLETDRRLFLKNHHGYETALAKMDPLEVTPKNDILVAWKPEAYTTTTTSSSTDLGQEGDRNHIHNSNSNNRLKDLFGTPDTDCKADIEAAKAHLLSASSKGEGAEGFNEFMPTNKRQKQNHQQQKQQHPPLTVDHNDWTQTEEAEIQGTILDFVEATTKNNTPEEVLVFPTGMGGRKRKLIHFVAKSLNLAHWGHGKKSAEKTVAVARSRPPWGQQLEQQQHQNTS